MSSNTFMLSEIANVVDCEHKTAPTVDAGEYYSIRTTDISNGRLDLTIANRVSYETYIEWTRRAIPQTGDLILAREAPVGEVGYVTSDHKVCLGQRTVLIQITNDSVDNKYLLYYLVNPMTKHNLRIRSTGSVVAHLNMKDIRNFEVILPPLPEQQAIAAVLSSLDDKIDLLHRQNKTLEALAQTLFRHWFVDGAEDDWEEKRLGDFVSIKHGHAFKGEYISTGLNKQILVTPGNFNIGGGFKEGKMKYYHSDDFPSEYVFASGDLIVTMTDLSKAGDTLGYPAFIPENKEHLYLHNQRVGKVLMKSEISKFFLYFIMKTEEYRGYILGSASGTSVIHTSPTSICNYQFSVPPKALIKKFDDIVSSFFEKIFKNTLQIRTLEKLRDTLLPKLMSGEVRVRL